MTPEQVQEIADKVLAGLYERRAQFQHEAINWADLRCVEAKEFKDGRWLILIEEAEPGCAQFQTAVWEALHERGINAIVKTEW